MSSDPRERTEALLTIGEFARAAGLSVTALRYYHEVGLLPAAHVDPVSRYRYYDASQQETARLLAVLRRLDLSLGEMTHLLAMPPVERSARLDSLAEEVLAAGASRAAALRHLAGEQRPGGGGGAAVTVDGGAFARELTAVLAFAGSAPMDGVLVEMSADVVTTWASDRFRLAKFANSARGNGGTGRVCLASTVATRLATDLPDGEVSLQLGTDGLVVAGQLVPVERRPFPDLASLMATFEGEATSARTLDPRELAGDADPVALAVAGTTIHVSRPLLTSTLAALIGEVRIAVDRPMRPVVLTCSGEPGRAVAIMPCRG